MTGALLALLLVLAGCGGGSGSTSASASGETSTTRISKAEEKEKFVEAVDDICFRHSQEQAKQVEAYERKHGIPLHEPNQAQQEKIIVAIILPIVRETIAELEEYEPIAAQEAKLNVFIKALTNATDVTENHPNLLAEEGENEPYHQARGRAADMGTYLCGQA